MVTAEQTFELRISFNDADGLASKTKSQVTTWLLLRGIDAFVEAAIDGLDIDFEEINWEALAAIEQAAETSALSLFKYDRPYLEALCAQLQEQFGERVSCELFVTDTSSWKEGWKDSFQPIETARFWIHPPWIAEKAPHAKLPIVLDPGMAFGTGQHATTQLCLEAIEALEVSPESWAGWKVMDVGTGTGILAIACMLLGAQDVIGTDIDPDALIAARSNAAANGVAFSVESGSVPKSLKADLVIANILTVVLKRILPDLVQAVSCRGKLILSGILAEEAGEMVASGERLGLNHVETRLKDDWCVITFEGL